MKYFKKLIGENLYLSPLCAEDAEMYVKWMNDFQVTDGIGASSRVLSVPMEKEWLENEGKSSNVNFAIVRLEKDELLGNCGLMDISYKDRIATVGIFIGDAENRGRGYGTETLRLLLDFGFHYLNLNNIHLNVKSFNEAAIRCYQKVGFQEYGRRRESYFLNGKYYDDVQMDILAREFEGDYIKNKGLVP